MNSSNVPNLATAPAVASIILVLRDAAGIERARQTFNSDETERAERIMIARNRVELGHRSGNSWGIETESPAVAPVYPACFAGLALDDVNYRLRHGLATKADAAQLVDWWNRSGKRVTVATLSERSVLIAGRWMNSPWICIS